MHHHETVLLHQQDLVTHAESGEARNLLSEPDAALHHWHGEVLEPAEDVEGEELLRRQRLQDLRRLCLRVILLRKLEFFYFCVLRNQYKYLQYNMVKPNLKGSAVLLLFRDSFGFKKAKIKKRKIPDFIHLSVYPLDSV